MAISTSLIGVWRYQHLLLSLTMVCHQYITNVCGDTSIHCYHSPWFAISTSLIGVWRYQHLLLLLTIVAISISLMCMEIPASTAPSHHRCHQYITNVCGDTSIYCYHSPWSAISTSLMRVKIPASTATSHHRCHQYITNVYGDTSIYCSLSPSLPSVHH